MRTTPDTSKARRILVGNDSPEDGRLLREILEGQGYDVDLRGGQAFLLERLEGSPDLILLDTGLSGEGAFQISRRLKTIPALAAVPVIFTGPVGDPGLRLAGFRAGGVDFVTRPFQAEEVLARVETHLRLKDLTDSLEQQVKERTELLMEANRDLEEEIAERRRVEENLTASLLFLRSLEKLDSAVWKATDMDQMVTDVLDVVLDVMGADRSWLLYPCDPDTPFWTVPMMRSKPEYEAVLEPDQKVPSTPEARAVFRSCLASDDPVHFGPGGDEPLPRSITTLYGVRSQLHLALYPKVDRPWVFGVHQCSHPRQWTAGEKKLFKALGARIADALNSLLVLRDLKESEERFRALVDQAQDAIFVHDLTGRFILVNQHACDILGYTREELSGMHVADIDPGFSSRNDPTLLWNDLPQTLESYHLKKNGELFPVEIRLSSITYGDRSVVHAAVRDITERKQLQAMMVQSEKMLNVAGMAAGMAHEIKNPLSGIMQSAQVLLTRLESRSAGNEQAARKAGCGLECIRGYARERDLPAMIQNIRESGSRMGRIVETMLEFSRRSEAGNIPSDLNGLMEKSIELCSSDYDLKKKYDFRQIQIDRLYDPSLPLVPCNPGQIEQVFTNLLRNSAQAMVSRKEGPRSPRLTLRTYREGSMACLDVEDNGPGMEEGVLKRIFEPFFTTKPVGEGTGLGLAVCQFIIANNHNGRIDVASSPGAGTRFTVRLPLETAAQGGLGKREKA